MRERGKREIKRNLERERWERKRERGWFKKDIWDRRREIERWYRKWERERKRRGWEWKWDWERERWINKDGLRHKDNKERV